MALLNRIASSGPRTRAALHFVVLLVLCAGCAWLNSLSGGPKRFAFSHAIHVVDEKLDCVMCHENLGVSDEPGMPVLDTCATCHDEIDEKKPQAQHVSTLFAKDQFVAAHASRLDKEQIFSHKAHVKQVKSCDACHAGIEHNQAISADIAVPMASCTACHAERKVASGCQTCHREIREDTAPASHAQDWKRFHGHVVRAGSVATADSCQLCHTESTCVQCHKEEAPQSHNEFFRLRSHGLMARMDRANCAVCHAPDSCDECHHDTRPLSHNGAWGSTRNSHCLSCHFPLQGEGCLVCHKSTPGHLAAAPKPQVPPHSPAMNCRQCHGISAPLPHFDKGDDCNACHH
jgi:hypothetical protein